MILKSVKVIVLHFRACWSISKQTKSSYFLEIIRPELPPGLHYTCLVFVFLQHRDSFLLESLNSLVRRLGFVVKVVSLVQPASHLPGVQLEVDNPDHDTAFLVLVETLSPRYRDDLFLECQRLLHIERETIDEKAIGPGHSLDHLLGEDVEDDLMGYEVASLHHREELGAALAA